MNDKFPKLMYENGTYSLYSINQFDVPLDITLPYICNKSHIPIYEKRPLSITTDEDIFCIILSIYIYNEALPQFSEDAGFMIADTSKKGLMSYIAEKANDDLIHTCDELLNGRLS